MSASGIDPIARTLNGAQILARLNALGAGGAAFTDSVFAIKGSVDATKKAVFEVDGFTTATTRTFTLPDATTTIAGLSVAQTFTAAQTVAAALTVNPGNAQASLTLGNVTGNTSVFSTMVMGAGSGRYSFLIGVQNNVANALEITPSTAVGGSSYTTPALQIAGATGLVTVIGLKVSGLTSTRVPYATTGGQLTDSGNMTFDGTNTFTVGAHAVVGIVSTSALFTESTFSVTGNAGLLVATVGDSYLNAASGRSLFMRVNNTVVATVAGASVSIVQPTTIAAGSGNSLTVNGVSAQWATIVNGNASVGNSFGTQINAGSNSSDVAMGVYDKTGVTQYFSIRGDGVANFSQVLTASAGVKLGAGSVALANYETGTFTPVIAGSSTAGTQTYSTQVGRYTRVGNRVDIQIDVALSALDGATAGNVLITGLPFTSANQTSANNGCTLVSVANTTLTGGKTFWVARIAPNESRITMEEMVSGGAKSSLPVGNLSATTNFRLIGTYEV